jgi:anhydro-N-acetylmuramic acid kinase
MALVAFNVDGQHIVDWKLEYTEAIEIPAHWKTRLSSLAGADAKDCFAADADLGVWIGNQCTTLIARNDNAPDAIASHGHTVLHRPEEGITVQIGNAAQIAAQTGCDVITGFRGADVAAGGQGAPLAPVVEHYLFPGYELYLNLGGIANISSFVQPGHIRAWDIVACNQVLNQLASELGLPYDDQGLMARKGMVRRALMQQLMGTVTVPVDRPFSLDNSWIRDTYVPLFASYEGSVYDKLATATEWIATSITTQARYCLGNRKGRILVTGGGAYNDYLVERIRCHVDPSEVVVPEKQIIDYKEAVLMALCGLLRILGIPNSFASVTGARYDTINGDVTRAPGIDPGSGDKTNIME